MFTIFTMLGEDVTVEHATSNGRIDLVLKTAKSIFVFELKYKKSADTSIAQISDKDYAKAFADDNRKVVKVGGEFLGLPNKAQCSKSGKRISKLSTNFGNKKDVAPDEAQ